MADIGLALRNARVERGLTIDQVAQDTRISPRFLEALEAEAFDDLPAPVYVRGFLRSYANYLKLDGESMVAALSGAAAAGAGERSPQRSADPFRRTGATAAVVLAPEVEPGGDGPDDEWDEPPLTAVATAGAMATVSDPLSARRGAPEAPLDGRGETGYRAGRVGGVLVERGEVYGGGGGRLVRWIAIGGGGLLVLLLFGVLVSALTGGGDDDGNEAAAGGPTATTGTGTIVPVGSVGSVTPTPSESPSATATGAAANPTATTGPGTPTPPPGPGTPTATATSVPATATAPPATPTPTPPPPTPTPTATLVPSHSSAFGECTNLGNGVYDCGPTPLLVVCPPGGWFVDVGKDYPYTQYGWTAVEVGSTGEAIEACQ